MQGIKTIQNVTFERDINLIQVCNPANGSLVTSYFKLELIVGYKNQKVATKSFV
jgi:hypothetical protein